MFKSWSWIEKCCSSSQECEEISLNDMCFVNCITSQWICTKICCIIGSVCSVWKYSISSCCVVVWCGTSSISRRKTVSPWLDQTIVGRVVLSLSYLTSRLWWWLQVWTGWWINICTSLVSTAGSRNTLAGRCT